MKSFAVLFIFCITIAMAFAKGDKDSNPCSEDRKKLCSECKLGDKSCVKECMHKNKASLSSACLASKAAKKAKK